MTRWHICTSLGKDATSPCTMDILRRYEEQLETTIETMRRRCIAIYDGTIRLGKRLSRLCENLREITEPVAYDVKEAVSSSYHFTTEGLSSRINY
uniref:Uncharacterized protein n=1 Tax=Ascaris lumbricoides TaxID=6252 RepID=A0A0M3II61_ASCLU